MRKGKKKKRRRKKCLKRFISYFKFISCDSYTLYAYAAAG